MLIRLRVSGEGQGGSAGGPNGDLYVFLQVKESQYFERDGNDIIYQADVSMAQAALGCQLSIPTLDDGKAEVEVPAGTQHGHRVLIAEGRRDRPRDYTISHAVGSNEDCPF